MGLGGITPSTRPYSNVDRNDSADESGDDASAPKRRKNDESSHSRIHPQRSQQQEQASDVNAHARYAIAHFFGFKKIDPELFRQHREELIKAELLTEGTWSDAQLQEEVNKKLQARPRIDEIIALIQEYEAESKKSVSLKPEEITGLNLSEEDEEKLKAHFTPAPGKQIIFEDNFKQRYLRSRPDNSCLEYQHQKIWHEFKAVDTVKDGMAKAHDKKTGYKAAYILNKPLASTATASTTASVKGKEKDLTPHVPSTLQGAPLTLPEFKDTRARFVRTYGGKDVIGQKAGRFFLVRTAATIFSRCTTDDSADFLNAIGHAKLRKLAALQDTLALLGEPLAEFELPGNKAGQHYTIELHGVTAGPDKQPFYFYVAQRNNVVLAVRAMESSPLLSHADVIRTMSEGVSRSAILTRIAAAKGEMTGEERLLSAKSLESEKKVLRAVTFHRGTPQECAVWMERISSTLLMPCEGKYASAIGTQKNACGYSNVHRFTWDAIQSSRRSGKQPVKLAETPDFEVRKYECSLPDKDDKNKNHNFTLYAVFHLHHEDGEICVLPRVATEGGKNTNETELVENMLLTAGQTVVTGKAILKEKAKFVANIPGIGKRELNSIHDFVLTPKLFSEFTKLKSFTVAMKDSGLSHIEPRDFLRKVLQSCGRPERTYAEDDQAVIDRYQVTILGKPFRVYIGHHADRVKNMIMYLELCPANQKSPSKKMDEMFESVRQNKVFIQARKGENARRMPARMQAPEEPSDVLFNVTVNGNNHVCEPAGDFVTISGRRSILRASGPEVEESKSIVKKCVQKIGNKQKFMREAIENAKLSTASLAKQLTYPTEHYKLQVYDTKVRGEKFKLAMATPWPYYQNLVVAADIRAEKHCDLDEMIANMTTRTLENTLGILADLRACKENKTPLPENLDVPDAAKQKLARLRASAQVNAGSTAETAASGSRFAEAIADADEMDTDDEGEEQGPSNVSAHSVQVYESDDALFDAITKGANLPDENAAIEAITAQLKALHLDSDFTEDEQLGRLGELWLAQVRHAPLPESTVKREETQRRLDPRIKQKWGEALRKSTSEVKADWKQEMAAARVAGKALRERINAFLKDLGMNVVVLGNAYEPLVRYGTRMYTYDDMIGWAKQQSDGGIQAAQDFLDWKNGSKTLKDLPEVLRTLVVITHFAEVARGYSADLEKLTTHMEKIANVQGNNKASRNDAKRLWGELAHAYSPALKAEADRAKEFDDTAIPVETDSESVQETDWEWEEDSAFTDEEEDIESVLATDKRLSLEQVLPRLHVADDVVDDLKDKASPNVLAFVLLTLLQKKTLIDPLDPDQPGISSCKTGLKNQAGQECEFIVTHDGDVLKDIDFPDDVPELRTILAVSPTHFVALTDELVEELKQKNASQAVLIDQAITELEKNESDLYPLGPDRFGGTIAGGHEVFLEFRGAAITNLEIFSPGDLGQKVKTVGL
jgi:hypothetical protein